MLWASQHPKLKKIKDAMHSTMNQNRLNNLLTLWNMNFSTSWTFAQSLKIFQ